MNELLLRSSSLIYVFFRDYVKIRGSNFYKKSIWDIVFVYFINLYEKLFVGNILLNLRVFTVRKKSII